MYSKLRAIGYSTCRNGPDAAAAIPRRIWWIGEVSTSSKLSPLSLE